MLVIQTPQWLLGIHCCSISDNFEWITNTFTIIILALNWFSWMLREEHIVHALFVAFADMYAFYSTPKNLTVWKRIDARARVKTDCAVVWNSLFIAVHNANKYTGQFFLQDGHVKRYSLHLILNEWILSVSFSQDQRYVKERPSHLSAQLNLTEDRSDHT